MAKLLQVILFLVGTGAGIGAGIFLMPPGSDVEDHSEGLRDTANGDDPSPEKSSKKDEKTADHAKGVGDDRGADPGSYDYIKLNNQFVVPVVASNRVEALVVMSLSIEAEAGLRDEIYAREPKIRDAFLQVLFDHANIGGFQGAFTRANNLDTLRTALTEVAQGQFGLGIHNVLIIDIARQDV